MRRTVVSMMILADLVALTISFALAAVLTQVVSLELGTEAFDAIGFMVDRAPHLCTLSLLLVGVFAFGGLYGRGGWELEEVRRIVLAVALIALFDASLQYLQKDHSSRLWFAFAWPLAAMMIIGSRMVLRSVKSVEQAMASHVLLIGQGVREADFVNDARESRSGAVSVLDCAPVTWLSRLGPDEIRARIRWVGAVNRIHASRVELVLAPDVAESADAQHLVDTLNMMGHPFSVVLNYHGIARRGLRTHGVIGADIVLAEVASSDGRPFERMFKRSIDLLSSVLLLALLSPLLVGISILLLLEGGPVLFRQTRVGYRGKRFSCLKFRTMLRDAERRLEHVLATDPAAAKEWAMYQKLSDDPRITRLGHMLRTTSLDELPQLINVLKGDMSLVGPRPIVAPEVPGYEADHAYLKSADAAYYCSFKPGITGLWQVSGRAHTSHDERIRLDAWYVRNWSVWLDLVILLKTFRAVIARTGA
ncbi:exopolysaccharide biosynthesis polyprenyl glycosylphosphotransferase [Limibaculum sp. M0105]|uniref:Exopolysaccharide biosynthesis polyprenyl glycosylphosphotransferase n=1 Tax=Thermohalobaculum xanthum TaxID=2753746 RepID=A0A8J7M6G5_9RHOB|nr:exopolysaccharide biosynthesis polyprenyl glycosylphosphotransferase [Thermohalobaculum xanthum]MBK0398737.1 exopolysaccharide biosynthesis polyprenyl glycosylphosphotransferase [Thermohalobaculum xanthum]